MNSHSSWQVGIMHPKEEIKSGLDPQNKLYEQGVYQQGDFLMEIALMILHKEEKLY